MYESIQQTKPVSIELKDEKPIEIVPVCKNCEHRAFYGNEDMNFERCNWNNQGNYEKIKTESMKTAKK